MFISDQSVSSCLCFCSNFSLYDIEVNKLFSALLHPDRNQTTIALKTRVSFIFHSCLLFSPLTNPPPFLSVYLYTIAMTSVADIFEDYVESKRMLMNSIRFFFFLLIVYCQASKICLQKLIKTCTNYVVWTKNFNVLCTCVDGLIELFFEIDILLSIGFREIYTKHRRSYAKMCRVANNSNASSTSTSPTTPTPSMSLSSARSQLEKDYALAVQKQDQKIDLTKRMYDLVTRHIERIDSQMAKSDISDMEWMGGAARKNLTEDTSWKFDRKRPSPHGAISVRKR